MTQTRWCWVVRALGYRSDVVLVMRAEIYAEKEAFDPMEEERKETRCNPRK